MCVFTINRAFITTGFKFSRSRELLIRIKFHSWTGAERSSLWGMIGNTMRLHSVRGSLEITCHTWNLNIKQWCWHLNIFRGVSVSADNWRCQICKWGFQFLKNYLCYFKYCTTTTTFGQISAFIKKWVHLSSWPLVNNVVTWRVWATRPLMMECVRRWNQCTPRASLRCFNSFCIR